MADIEHIAGILKNGIRFGAVARIHPRQLDAAAGLLAGHGHVSWRALEQIGRDLTGDRMFFCEVDIEQLNQVLGHPELVGSPRQRK